VLTRLATERFDVLVIGGGVTGAGTALDAASRGLRVALVEARDLASGTSSRSSKLIHGGLRYLEQFDFKLVYEALRERDLLVSKLAPHLVKPVSFLYPLYKKVVERPYVGAGLVLYDAMEGTRRPVPHHRHLTTRGALRRAFGEGSTGKGVAKAVRGAAGALRELEDRQKSRATRAKRDTLEVALLDLAWFYRDVLAVQPASKKSAKTPPNRRPRPLIGKLRHAQNRRIQFVGIQRNNLPIILGQHRLKVRELPRQLARSQQPRSNPEEQRRLILGKVDRLRVGRIQQRLQLVHRLLRH